MKKTVRIFETNYKEKKFLQEQKTMKFRPDAPGADGQENSILNIYDQVHYQKITGFGGAFTEASALNFQGLSKEQKKQIITDYFDAEKGIGYNFCRGVINSCDFSEKIRAYDEVDGDYELKHFSIKKDKEAIIPMMKAAKKISENLLIFSSPWSPPAWMKTNGRMDKGGSLKKECQDAWARYLAKYITEYEKAGVSIWGITIQNEAKAAQGWESCVYMAGEERDFATGYLKPAMEKAGLGDKKILFWDHNKERLVDRGLDTLCNERSRTAFDGVAVHWYAGDHFGALDAFHQLFPEKEIFATEQCKGKTPDIPYDSGEVYAHDIIGDLNNWVTAWIDWNMFLDENGGPDHWKDEQFETGWDPEKVWEGESPIMINKKTGKLEYSSSFYYIGHFSKFIKRGAVRIGQSIFSSRLETCAFLNPDGTVIVVAMNATDEDHDVTLRYHEELLDISLKSHSIMTFVF